MINKLLLIDDDELTSYLLQKLIKGVRKVKEFVIKENGLEAFEYLEGLKSKEESFPDVILLDIDMPVMNGFEFVELYEKHYWRKYMDLKLVMITSSTRKMDFERSLSFQSVSDCIYKPISREKMNYILGEAYTLHANKY